MTPKELIRLHRAALRGQLDGLAILVTLVAGAGLFAGLAVEHCWGAWRACIIPTDYFGLWLDGCAAVLVLKVSAAVVRTLRGR